MHLKWRFACCLQPSMYDEAQYNKVVGNTHTKVTPPMLSNIAMCNETPGRSSCNLKAGEAMAPVDDMKRSKISAL